MPKDPWMSLTVSYYTSLLGALDYWPPCSRLLSTEDTGSLLLTFFPTCTPVHTFSKVDIHVEDTPAPWPHSSLGSLLSSLDCYSTSTQPLTHSQFPDADSTSSTSQIQALFNLHSHLFKILFQSPSNYFLNSTIPSKTMSAPPSLSLALLYLLSYLDWALGCRTQSHRALYERVWKWPLSSTNGLNHSLDWNLTVFWRTSYNEAYWFLSP